jgi:hypothetical protein
VRDARAYYTPTGKAVVTTAVTQRPNQVQTDASSAEIVAEYQSLIRKQQEQQQQEQQRQQLQQQYNQKMIEKSALEKIVDTPTVKAPIEGLSTMIDELKRTTPLPGLGFLEKNLIERIAKPIEESPLSAAAEATRIQQELERLKNLPPAGANYNFLILSGGVSHGAYQAGVIQGWHDTGTMPCFDVVTGVSTGALGACALFPGPDYIPDLSKFYTTVSQNLVRGDIWKVKALPPIGIGTDSVATNEPLRELIREVLNKDNYFEKVAAEHARGRRLYVGTTNLDTQRFVVWDMGAIASEGTPESRQLYEDIMAASAAMPGLLSPSRIKIAIDGKLHEEMHVDGGTTRNLFFYPPSDWPGDVEDKKTGYKMLAGANVYVIIAGKIYNDPEGTNPSLFSVGFRSLGTLLSALQRAELARLTAHCRDRDMKFHLAAIPEDYVPLFPASEFKPEHMKQLYCYGYNQVLNNTVWSEREPARAVSEDRARRSTNLTTTPSEEIGPLAPPRRNTPVIGTFR